jgi:hypothetical protein
MNFHSISILEEDRGNSGTAAFLAFGASEAGLWDSFSEIDRVWAVVTPYYKP